jgi:glycosyltransferase involved in cell wall biosynthesis
MTDRAPISLCLIVKNEEANIENCLRSIRPYVEEIVVVDTGSTDKTPEIVKKYADIFEVYTECNYPDGRIKSFSMARQRSFDLATKEWAMWIDGDDIVVGADKLPDLIREYDKQRNGSAACVMLPYEYAHDAEGKCICLHYRERIITPRSVYKWVNPVHEVMVPMQGTSVIQLVSENIRMIHKRQQAAKAPDPFRNLRIIKEFVDNAKEEDPRQLYYLGLEYSNVNDIDNAIKTLMRYVEITGWDDEKALACLKLCELHMRKGEPLNAIPWATKAITVHESWGECFFELAKCYYVLADKEQDQAIKRRNYEKCATFAKIGLSLPPTRTVLFVNPQERDIEIHRYLNISLNYIGDVSSALDSVNFALKHKPNDEQLNQNKKLYEIHLAKVNAINTVQKLTSLGLLDKQSEDVICSTIGGQALTIDGANVPLRPVEQQWKPFHRPQGYPLNVTEQDFPRPIVTPHAQAWGIPEQFVYDDLPLIMSDAQLQAMVCATWKEFMWHDELLSAISFLKNAPYRVRHSDTTEMLLAKTRAMIAWTDTEEKFDAGNATKTAADLGEMRTTEMCPIGEPLWGQAGARMHWISDRMPKKGALLLDFGCIDGEMSNRWGLDGYKVTGLDICSNSVNIANASALANKTGATHIRTFFKDAPKVLNGQKFDYLTCADTYEHIIHDHVEDLLKPARELVKEDGKMLLVTPHGAWFRGKYLSYVHPWLWAQTRGDHWLAINDRAHVIAPTVWSVAEHFRAAGWWVSDSVVVMQHPQDCEGQGNVCVEAFPNPPPGWPGKDIVFYVGNGAENWTPHTVDVRGIGGSETAVIQMAKRFVAAGNRVRVYNSCGKDGEGIYLGVEYIQAEKFHDLKCDVLIVSRYAPGLDASLNVDAKVKYLWTHDVVPQGLTHELALRADKIFALSNWHKQNILTCYGFIKPDQIIVTRNGIDLERFVPQARNPHKAIYSSSPDRGLHVLLKTWPEIKKKVPDAELHVFYGFSVWRSAAVSRNDMGQLRLIDELNEKLVSMASLGVHFHDRVNQQTLAQQFCSAGVWAYPTWFTETSCITAMEAQAAGLKIITSPIAALNETVNSRGTMILGDWLSDDYQRKFIDATVDAMLNTTDDERSELSAHAKANFSWDGVATDWIKIFDEHLADQPMPEYKDIVA